MALRGPLQSLAARGAVHAVTFTPDGKTMIAGGDDGRVRLFDTATWRERVPPHGHAAAARAVVFTPDGRKLISAGGDHVIRVWDLTQPRREPDALRGHAGPILSLALDPDGRTLASSSWDGTVRLWNLADGSDLAVLGEHAGRVTVAFAPNGKTLATGDSTAIRWWNPADPARPLHIRSKEDITGTDFKQGDGRILVTGLVFSPDGRILASVDASRTVKLWETATAKEISGLRLGGDSFALSPDGKTLAASQTAGTEKGLEDLVTLWDLAERKELARLSVHRGRVTSLAFSPGRPDACHRRRCRRNPLANLHRCREGKVAVARPRLWSRLLPRRLPPCHRQRQRHRVHPSTPPLAGANAGASRTGCRGEGRPGPGFLGRTSKVNPQVGRRSTAPAGRRR